MRNRENRRDSLARHPILALLTGAALLGGLAACDDTPSGPDGATSTVSLGFRSTVTQGAVSAGVGADGFQPSITVGGSNGTLTIDAVHLVVAEFELDRDSDDACDDDDVTMGDCETFEADPQFISVPLEGGTVEPVEQAISPGTYESLKFEVEDLDVDDGGDDDGDEESDEAGARDLLENTIRAEFPEWPAEASMRVEGSFLPDGADPAEAVPFVVYFEAEVKVEIEFDPEPLVIAEDAVDPTVTVLVDPSAWFVNPDGSVLDLSAFDFDPTQPAEDQLLEFEAEMENGFTEIELDLDD